MHRHVTLCGALIGFLLLAILLVGNTIHAQPDPAKGGDPRPVAAATNDFAFRLYAELNKNAASNLFFSPTSLSMALSMTYNGAVGTTKDGMAKALGIQGMDLTALNTGQAALFEVMEKSDPKVTVALANALFAKKDYIFLDDFLQRNREYYHARITNTDVTTDAGVKEVNDWVAQQTRNKITDLLKKGDLDELTRLILVNAIYFKGAWTEPFDKAETKEANFTLADGKTKKVQMMHTSKEFRYLQGDDFQAVSLPFGQGRMSMYFFLPAKGTSLAAFSKRLTAANWQQWMGKFNKQQVILSMPRFKASYEALMNDPLIALGMENAFSETKADFSGMDGTRRLFIKLVRHKAVLEVNEEGAEAAAATAVVMSTKAAPMPIEMPLDHPFFCAIRDDNTGAILFMGNIANPE